MNVLCLTNMYPSKTKPWSGCFVRDQVEDLRRLGVNVTVLAFDASADARAYARAAARLRRTLIEEPIDLVHAHYGLTGAVALSQRRAPVVVTFHGSDTGYVRWQGAISWFVARGAEPVFVNRESARRLGRPSAEVICAPVDVQLFTPCDRLAARRALGWSESGHYVLLPGSRDSRVKRPDLFAAVMHEAQQSEQELRGVSLEGFSRPESAHVMNAVDVTLMTSDAEGAPVAIKESLACMTPVVSVAVGDVPSLITGLPGCAIARRDPRALAHGVLNALGITRRGELRARVEQFSRSRTAGRTLALYRRILAGAAA